MAFDKAIELFAEKLLGDLRDTLQKKLRAKSKSGHDGNSRLGASLKIVYYRSGSLITGFQITANDYHVWVNAGRSKGGVSIKGQENIERWIKTRGIKPNFDKQLKTKKKRISKLSGKQIYDRKVKQLTFLISRKLKNKGYEGTHFVNEVLGDGRIERFNEYILKQYQIELELEIKNTLNGSNN
jgi:hypothetical protein